MTHLLLTWGYVALFVATVLAAMGIPTGSELVIAYAGALASGHVGGSGHHLNLAVVIVFATLGELIGSFAGYGIGRLGGRTVVERLGRYVMLTNADLDRAELLFARHGEPVVFLGRFIPLVRSFVGLAAGLAEMTAAKFAVFTALAAAIWCAVFALLGDALGASWDKVLHNVSNAGYVIAPVVIMAVFILLIGRLRVLRAERAALSTVPAEQVEP
jgi:membrane protein DedA with SNARE-associated domain